MKDIKNYENLYAITEDGQIWSHRSKKFLKPNVNRNGYEYVVFSVDGIRKTLTVHRLVAETYIPNPSGLPEVNHVDENKLNNNITNLCWTTASENINHGTRNQRASKKLKKSIYCEELNKVFDSMTAASKELGVNLGDISSCCKGKLKSAGGYHWRYADELLG